MGVLLQRRFLFEAEDDAGTTDNAAPSDAGTADTNANDSTGDTSADNNAEDTTNTDDVNDNADDNNEDDFNIDDNDDDFNIDTGDDNNDGGDGNDNNDQTGTTSSMPSSPDDDGPVVPADSLKAKDGEIFDSLDPAEQEIKLRELKQQFIDLYQTCDDIIERINSVTSYDEYIETLKRITYTLFCTKRMISDHILHIFDSKSYHENDIRYTEFLSIINTVKNIIKDINNGIKDTNSDS